MWSTCTPLALAGVWLSCDGWRTLVCLTRGSCCVIKRADFHFNFIYLFIFALDRLGRVAGNSQTRRKKRNWTRAGGGAAALNENSPRESKCKLQRGCLGLVSPIIEEGPSSKDEGVLLYMHVAVSDKQDLFFAPDTQGNCVCLATSSLFCSQQ